MIRFTIAFSSFRGEVDPCPAAIGGAHANLRSTSCIQLGELHERLPPSPLGINAERIQVLEMPFDRISISSIARRIFINVMKFRLPVKHSSPSCISLPSRVVDLGKENWLLPRPIYFPSRLHITDFPA